MIKCGTTEYQVTFVLFSCAVYKLSHLLTYLLVALAIYLRCLPAVSYRSNPAISNSTEETLLSCYLFTS